MSDVTARPWWLWMEGMLGCLSETCGPTYRVGFIADAGNALQEHHWKPVETDPATIGCLTQRARDLWGDPTLSAWRSDCDEVWYVRCRRGYMTARGSTEWAALVAACDAAPQR